MFSFTKYKFSKQLVSCHENPIWETLVINPMGSSEHLKKKRKERKKKIPRLKTYLWVINSNLGQTKINQGQTKWLKQSKYKCIHEWNKHGKKKTHSALCNFIYFQGIYTQTCYLSHCMTKQTKLPLRPVTTQISLGIRPDWPESLLSAWRNLGALATH